MDSWQTTAEMQDGPLISSSPFKSPKQKWASSEGRSWVEAHGLFQQATEQLECRRMWPLISWSPLNPKREAWYQEQNWSMWSLSAIDSQVLLIKAKDVKRRRASGGVDSNSHWGFALSVNSNRICLCSCPVNTVVLPLQAWGQHEAAGHTSFPSPTSQNAMDVSLFVGTVFHISSADQLSAGLVEQRVTKATSLKGRGFIEWI